MKAFLLTATTTIMSIVATAPAAASQNLDKPSGEASATQSYSRAYFNQYNPHTALEIIDRLPGFVLDRGGDLRGFGGGAGNVLINGARPSSKEGGVEEALKRIPASRVEQVIVMHGTAGASEASGHSVVANVIISAAKTSGYWKLETRHPSDSRLGFTGEATVERIIAGWNTSTKIDAAIDRSPLEGTRMTRNAAGKPIFFEIENSPSKKANIIISSKAQRDAFGGVLHLTSRFNWQPYSVETTRQGYEGRTATGTPDQLFGLEYDRTKTSAEFGADWTRILPGDWKLKLLSLSTYNGTELNQFASTEQTSDASTNRSIFASEQTLFETVMRSTLSRRGKRRLRPEFGAEVAYNRMDSDLSLRTVDSSATSIITLPAANVVVQEVRAEAFGNVIWSASQRTTLEAGLSAEVSRISVSGDARNARSFTFLKPSASFIFDATRNLQLRLGLRHEVAQLDFSDFAASASASDDRLTAGNPGIRPDQATRLSLATDWRFKDRIALNVEIFHDWKKDILEEIALPSGEFGLGNAGSARVWGLNADASFSLAPIIPGARLELEAEFLKSTFDDPITGDRRTVSNTDSPTILAQFRQDLPELKVAWGASYRAPYKGTFFFADEESYNRDGQVWDAFIESTRFEGVKVKLTFVGIGAQNFLRHRRLFSPDRSGIYTGSQRISRDEGMAIGLSVSAQY